MAKYKLVNGEQLNADLSAVAAAIREKGNTAEQLAFPEGFITAIDGIQSGSQVDELFLFSTDQIETFESDKDGSLKSYLWRENKNLRQIRYTNLKVLGKYMFQSCTSLVSVDFPAATQISSGCFTSCTSLPEAWFPNVLTIDGSGFERCYALVRCDLPKVRTISAKAFYTCSALVTLILRGDAVATLANTNALSGTPIEIGAGYIYVPAALLEAYRAAENWSVYASQFRAIEDYPEICGGGV